MKQQLLWLLLFSSCACMFAQEEEAEKKEKYWSDTLDVSAVFSEGNTIANAFSLKNELTYEKGKHKVSFGLLTIHKDITSETETAVLEDDGSIRFIKDSETDTIEEKFGGRIGYERKLHNSWYFESVADWFRDRLAGVDSRAAIHAGFGHFFANSDTRKFKLGAALGFTTEEPTVADSTLDEDFLSIRIAYEWMIKFSDKAKFQQHLALSGNGDDSNDVRGVMDTTIVNKFNSHLGLKAGLLLLWDNQPALVDVPLATPDGTALDPISIESEELDSVLTMSLSISF